MHVAFSPVSMCLGSPIKNGKVTLARIPFLANLILDQQSVLHVERFKCQHHRSETRSDSARCGSFTEPINNQPKHFAEAFTCTLVSRVYNGHLTSSPRQIRQPLMLDFFFRTRAILFRTRVLVRGICCFLPVTFFALRIVR